MLMIYQILDLLLGVVFTIMLVHVIMSWLISFQILNLRQPFVYQLWDGLNRLLEPDLSPDPPHPARHRRARPRAAGGLHHRDRPAPDHPARRVSTTGLSGRDPTGRARSGIPSSGPGPARPILVVDGELVELKRLCHFPLRGKSRRPMHRTDVLTPKANAIGPDLVLFDDDLARMLGLALEGFTWEDDVPSGLDVGGRRRVEIIGHQPGILGDPIAGPIALCQIEDPHCAAVV